MWRSFGAPNRVTPPCGAPDRSTPAGAFRIAAGAPPTAIKSPPTAVELKLRVIGSGVGTIGPAPTADGCHRHRRCHRHRGRAGNDGGGAPRLGNAAAGGRRSVSP
ncbi:hypothetical protein BBK14_26255 [Parafrankia soli]|uniref:Uncharacterized protein n=1 Tax=Parafrankia soli TaxID=2599596 RepID=A0A1S1PK22_9ACTN|nr:hypothetical protein BBK14_26255 [Parafrankia soli]